MSKLPLNTILQKIEDHRNGSIYSITFVKRTDGSIRTINTIKGTRRGVKGVGLRFDPAKKSLLPVYDLQAARRDPSNPDKAWRFVALDSILSVAMNGEVLEVAK